MALFLKVYERKSFLSYTNGYKSLFDNRIYDILSTLLMCAERQSDLTGIAMTAVWGGEQNTARATKWTVRPSLAHSFAMTRIRDNDTSIRSAPDTMKTGGVPAVCVAFERTGCGTAGL